ncbi:DNA/RNA non-specific endonuclease [Flavobacterium enshiense]|uniref:DNA/RNA non-specific endonuclease n=1 Tax=Flavobacterium enshiense TaxID=1341165 RepID=UPI00345CA052
MNRKTHTLTLKNASPSELARVKPFLQTLWQAPGSDFNDLIHTPAKKGSNTKKTANPSSKKQTQSGIKRLDVRGFIIAEKGIRLHYTPSPNDAKYKAKVGRYAKVYKPSEMVTVIHEELENNGWYKIKTLDGQFGFIEKSNIVIIPKDNYLDRYTQTFHYVKSGENFENNIAKVYFKNYKLETGNDMRTIAEAFYLLNTQSKHSHGITLKENIGGAKIAELGLKASFDPTFNSARLLYSQLQLSSKHIVRIPNKKYIELQRQLGSLSSRPEFMNLTIKAVDAAGEILQGAAGVIVGIIEGILRGIYDALEGLVDMVGSIIQTIKDLIAGTFFSKIKKMYETVINMISNLKPSELLDMFLAILGNVGESIKKTIKNWVKSSSFEKGRVIGIFLGTILLEILVAIFTGGSANLAKWTSKLGKLGKVLLKIAELGDEVREKLKANKHLKKLFKKGEYEKDSDADGKNWQRWALLLQARATAKLMDAQGANETMLLTALNTQAKLYPKLNVTWPKKDVKAQTFDLWMKASEPKRVVDDFSPGEKEKKEKKKEIKKNDKKRLQVNSSYIKNGYEYSTDNKGRINSAKGKLRLEKGTRNPYRQRNVGKSDGRLPNDQGGHLIGDQFGGFGGNENLVPMDKTINNYHSGEWGQMEKKWAKSLKNTPKVDINIEIKIKYSDETIRPSHFEIKENIDGKIKNFTIFNE